MPVQFLIHDHAMTLAATIQRIAVASVSEEDKRRVFGLLYNACKAAIEQYEEKADRLHRRVKPGNASKPH